MPDANAEILVMCLGGLSGVSRLIAGKVADLPKVNRVRMQQLAFLFLGIATSCIPLANHFGLLVALVCVMAICDGCFICLLGPIAFDLLGPAGAAQGLGCLLGLMSIPMTAGPPLAGLAYDFMQTYDIAFYAAGAPPILGACVLFLMPRKAQEQSLDLPAVTITETLAAMSMENLDKIGNENYDVLYLPGRGHVKFAGSEEYILSKIKYPGKLDKKPGHLFHSIQDMSTNTDRNPFQSLPHALNKV